MRARNIPGHITRDRIERVGSGAPRAASRSLHPPQACVHRLVFHRYTRWTVTASPSAPPIHHQKCESCQRYQTTLIAMAHLRSRRVRPDHEKGDLPLQISWLLLQWLLEPRDSDHRLEASIRIHG
jgi:hypothetical protein